jgi:hypothetical protein
MTVAAHQDELGAAAVSWMVVPFRGKFADWRKMFAMRPSSQLGGGTPLSVRGRSACARVPGKRTAARRRTREEKGLRVRALQAGTVVLGRIASILRMIRW